MDSLSAHSKVLLWGGTGKSKILLHMLKDIVDEHHTTIFDSNIDDIDYPFLGEHIKDIDKLNSKINSLSHFAVCVGGEHGFARTKISEALEQLSLQAIEFRSAQSFICDSVEIGKGVQIMPSTTVNSFTTLGDFVVLNTGATVDHDCLIGNGVHIMGSASLAGQVTIKDYATIGTNATILPNITIGEGAFVGAGAVVTKNVNELEVVAGVPAKKIRMNQHQYFNDDVERLLSS